MSVRSQISKNAAMVAKGRKRRGATGISDETNLGFDLSKISEELAQKVTPTAVAAAATIVRKAAKEDVANGGTDTIIGPSRKTETRGVPAPAESYSFKHGKRLRKPTLKKANSEPRMPSIMVNTGRGAWSNKIVKRRGGPRSKGLADTGGIIKGRLKRANKGRSSSQVVGPKYARDSSGRNYGHTHEPASGSGSGAPNHKWWGKPAKVPLRPRPFLRPAADRTIVDQMSAVKKALVKWDIDPGEVVSD